MDVTRLAGVALASALMFSCAGRVAPEDTASISDRAERRPPATVQEVQAEESGEARG